MNEDGAVFTASHKKLSCAVELGALDAACGKRGVAAAAEDRGAPRMTVHATDLTVGVGMSGMCSRRGPRMQVSRKLAIERMSATVVMMMMMIGFRKTKAWGVFVRFLVK